MEALNLDEFTYLFRDSQSYEQFVQQIEHHLQGDFAPLMVRKTVIGSVLSAEATKEVLYERLIKTISKSPKLLDEIQDRIEKDEIVD